MSLNMPAGRRWSDSQNADFAAMWNDGQPLDAIARRFGITQEAAYARARWLRRHGLALQRRAVGRRADARRERRCLACGRGFMSSHAGNRLCPPCALDESRHGVVR